MPDKRTLLQQVTDEYQSGLNYVIGKRQQYRERILVYDEQAKSREKINIHDIYNTIDTLIATTYLDNPSVKFQAKDGFLAQEQADKLNHVADSDFREDDYEMTYYQKEWDRYFYGVGLRIQSGRDSVRSLPLWKSVDPLSWIPDPMPTQEGKFNAGIMKYFGFVMQANYYDIVNDPMFDVDALNVIETNWINTQEDQTRWYSALSGNYRNYSYGSANTFPNFAVDLYFHYTIHDNKKWKVVLDGGIQQILAIEEITAVTKEEKEDPYLVPWPLVVNYYKPKRRDPFGTSICDLLESKQRAKSVLFNLSVIKAKKEALGGDFLVNQRMIKNRRDLMLPRVDSKMIPVDLKPGEALQNAMVEVPRSQIKADVFNTMNMLERESSLDTGIDASQLGVRGDRSITATESQIIQANSNIKSILNNKVNAWGEKDFWFLWWRTYQKYFSKIDDKFITMKSGLEDQGVMLEKDDFLGKYMPNISITSVTDFEAENNKNRALMNANLPIILQDPSIPEISKSFAKRRTYKLNGMKQSQIELIVPKSPDERKAEDYMKMVSLDILPESILEGLSGDLFTYWIYLNKAKQTPAKEAALLAISQAMTQQGLEAPMPSGEGMGGIANSAANAMIGNALSTAGDQPPSRENLVVNEGNAG